MQLLSGRSTIEDVFHYGQRKMPLVLKSSMLVGCILQNSLSDRWTVTIRMKVVRIRMNVVRIRMKVIKIKMK